MTFSPIVAKVDKYGRKLQSKASDQQMKRFYQLQKGEAASDDEENSEDEEDDDEDQEDEEDDISVSGSDSEEQGDDVYDPMRGRGVISGSDSDSDIDEEAAAELDREAEAQEDDEEEEEDDVPRGDESHRFACVNLDWDHVKVPFAIQGVVECYYMYRCPLNVTLTQSVLLCENSRSICSRCSQDSKGRRELSVRSRSTPPSLERSAWSVKSARDHHQRSSRRLALR